MEFLDIAIDAASKSCGYYQHGALLIRNGNVISVGFNDSRHHAELSAIENGYRVLWGQNRKVV